MDETDKRREQSNPDVPRRLRPADIAERYKISERLAGDWLRAMAAAGVVAKVKATKVGRWSRVDAWVSNGGSRRGGK